MDDRLAALEALREALIARGVPAQYLHLEALLEIEAAAAALAKDVPPADTAS